MKFLYWNLNSRPNIGAVRDILTTHEVDHAVFSEFGKDPILIGKGIADLGYSWIQTFSNLDTAHFTRYRPSFSKLVHENNHLVVVEVASVIGPKLLVAGVHLPSKLHKDERNQYDLATEYARTILELENRTGNRNTIVVGDFNFSPFESPMVGHKAFHATMNKKKAKTNSRIVDEVERPFFYNPMWKMYGKNDDLMGTYYTESSSSIEYYWHIFDQVIFRPDLLEFFTEDELDILVHTGSSRLVDSHDVTRFEFSDHLPIKFEMKFI